MPSQFEREIREQPESLARLLDSGREEVASVASAIRAFDPRFVMIAARGTSDNAARYAQYLFGAQNRLPVALATPSLFTLYHAPPRLSGSLVIGISQSGASPDIVAVLDEAHRQGALTLAITNEAGSDLAGAAELCLSLRAEPERAVAASKTYTSQLAALAMLSVALDDGSARRSQLSALPTLVSETLRLNDGIGRRAMGLADSRQFVVIGRGYNYASAYEVALKIKETSYVVAEAYSSAEFLHGPIAVIDEGFPAIVIAPSGEAFADVESLHDRLDERDARLIAITDRHELLGRASIAMLLPPGVPEWISPIVAVVPGQLFALALAQAKGIDPDHPRGLSKVTRTH